MVAFLRDGEFLFFPEVILATTLSPKETDNDTVREFFENIRAGRSSRVCSHLNIAQSEDLNQSRVAAMAMPAA
jgi:hypothetical protein